MNAMKRKKNPDNQLDKRLQGKEKKDKKQAVPLNLEEHVVTPNTLVPFEQVVRIQGKFYLELDNRLVPYSRESLKDDYGGDAVKMVRKYTSFVNVPSHVNYLKSIGKNYNLYRPLPHKPKKGEFPNIEKMLRHIFRGKHYDMILTFFWVLYLKPMHPLPFLALVSDIKGTGKTKFLQLLKAIFSENAKFIDPEVISGNFNSAYIDKLCILIDEKIDGKHRKQDLQKLKKLITGGTQNRKAKYQHDVDVDCYNKFCMCGNDEHTMLALEKENTRFWIIDVPKIETEDVDILEKAVKEIPAFLYFLETEYKPMPRKSRLWFSPEDFQTERSRILQRNSRPELAKEIEERLSDYFIEHEHLNSINFSANHFLIAFPMHNISGNYFGRVITTEFNMEAQEKKIGNPFFNDLDLRRCKCYTFHRSDVIRNKGEPKQDDKKFYDFDSIE